MSIEIRLPQLGESITHAKLSLWLKKEGERVSRGDVIAEVETDKTSVEIESPGDGILSHIHVPAGTDSVAIDELLAVLDSGTQDVPSNAADESARRESPHVVHLADARSSERTAAAVAAVPVAAGSHDPAPVARFQPDVAASPLARRMAYAAGLSLSAIRGTGSGGRITKEDVDAALGPASQKPAPAGRPASPVTTRGAAFPLPADDSTRYELEALSTMRRVSAERLTQSKQNIPHFYLRVECSMDEVSRVRDQLNARAAEKLSFTAFTLRAAALALKRVPAANAMWADGSVRLYKVVDLAVAVNTPSGLIAPVVRNADEKSVVTINREIRELAERARAGRLKPEEYTGGTCTVSNLGMFGVTSLYPIINPPQTCILGVGAIEERPVVRDHALAVGRMMTCTLAADHRALDGAIGAEFLSTFRQFAEDPWALLL
jgi:pyruvate dehydrogenase E2 component (dihydrolipoamide acetyltransferase)